MVDKLQRFFEHPCTMMVGLPVLVVLLLVAMTGCKTPKPPPPTVYEITRTEFPSTPEARSASPAVGAATTQATKAENTAANHYREVLEKAPVVEPGAKATLSDVRDVVRTLVQAVSDAKDGDAVLTWYQGYAKGLEEKIRSLEATNAAQAKTISQISNELTAAQQELTSKLAIQAQQFEQDQKAKDEAGRRLVFFIGMGVCGALILACGILAWSSPKDRRIWIMGIMYATAGMAACVAGLLLGQVVAWIGIGIIGIMAVGFSVLAGIVLRRETKDERKDRVKAEDAFGAISGAVEIARKLDLIDWTKAAPVFMSQAASRQNVTYGEVQDMVKDYTKAA